MRCLWTWRFSIAVITYRSKSIHLSNPCPPSIANSSLLGYDSLGHTATSGLCTLKVCACVPLLQHTSHGEGRQEIPSRTSRSGARCRNSIASCADEQPHIGNYRLLKTIGKGNFAKVKLARHILTGREVKCSTGNVFRMVQGWKSCRLWST